MALASPQSSDKDSAGSDAICTKTHECHNHGHPKAQVSANYIISGKTYYLVKFADGDSKARYYLKHYDDFVAVRAALQQFIDEMPWNEAPISILPQLPETGRYGFRRSLSKVGMGSFGQKLQEELDGWLHMILAQLPTLSVLPALDEFFGPDPLPASMSEEFRTKLEDVHAMLVRGASAAELATAAAKKEKEDDKRNDEHIEGGTVTLLHTQRRQLQRGKTAGAFAFESAGLEQEDGKSIGETVTSASQRRRTCLETQGEKSEGDAVAVSNQRRRQLRRQQTAGSLAFENVGLEKADEKREGEEERTRQWRTQQIAGALAFESAGSGRLGERSGAEEERSRGVSMSNPRRRQLRTQGTAGSLAFEKAGF